MNEIQISGAPLPKTKTGLPNMQQYLVGERVLSSLPRIRGLRYPTMRAPWSDPEHGRQINQYESNISEMRKTLEVGATEEEISAVETALRGLLGAAADPKLSMLAIGLLLDAQVKPPHNPQAFLHIATIDVVDEGYSPGIVASACQRLRRKATFASSVAEILAECKSVKNDYIAALSSCGDAIKTRQNIERDIAGSITAIANLRVKVAEPRDGA